jgi:elongation factor 2
MVEKVFRKRRGSVSEVMPVPGSLYDIKAYLPVVESYGFSKALNKAASGEAIFHQYLFDHWDLVPSDPMEAGTLAAEMVTAIHRRKGLNEKNGPFIRF